MNKAQVIHELGPPDVMCWEDWEVPPPGEDEVRLRHTAIGVNFADTYHRGGISHPLKVPPRPCVIGFEAVGVIEDAGAGVTEFKIGDRAAYAVPPMGSYAQARNYPANKLLRVPDDIDDKTLAALLMKGLTAQFLLHRTYAVQPGDAILVHAAAGAMGLILCRWARAIGATIIGTVSTPEKAEIARSAGCHHPVVRSEEDFVSKCREVTDGKGVAVVYESIGKDTLQKSLDCLRLLGVCAAYGHASGPPEPIDIIQDLGARGSLFITRPAYLHYMAEREQMVAAAEVLFQTIRNGIIEPNINYEYPLKDAVKAHQAIESGTTTGTSVLLA
jgi:NADPH2:quinone reductase